MCPLQLSLLFPMTSTSAPHSLVSNSPTHSTVSHSETGNTCLKLTSFPFLVSPVPLAAKAQSSIATSSGWHFLPCRHCCVFRLPPSHTLTVFFQGFEWFLLGKIQGTLLSLSYLDSLLPLTRQPPRFRDSVSSGSPSCFWLLWLSFAGSSLTHSYTLVFSSPFAFRSTLFPGWSHLLLCFLLPHVHWFPNPLSNQLPFEQDSLNVSSISQV